jgi:hypothetical protein
MCRFTQRIMEARTLMAPLAAAWLVGCSGADGRSLLSTSSVPDGGEAAVDGGVGADDASSREGAAVFDEPGAGDSGVAADSWIRGPEGGVDDGGPADATLGGWDGSRDAAVAGEDATPTPGDGSLDDRPGVSPLPALHTVGNRIYDNATPVVLTGVNRAGTEYACVHGTGIFDGPSDAASVRGIKSWAGVNAVRIPLNEDCWLGLNGVPSQYAAANYQSAIARYVTHLLENGLYPILDLHWSAAGSQLATGQAAMPDQDHSPTFWSQVAGVFKDNLGVAFELFNEPNPAGGQETSEAWSCWRDGSPAGDGGACSGIGYAAAGMQALLSAVRSAGANNLVLLGGVVSANALSQWPLYVPTDPANNVAAAWHVYPDRPCSTTSCFDAKVDVVAQAYPVVATELGERDCQGTFVTTVTGWLDSRQQNYLAFSWDAWFADCQALVADYVGTPTIPYGQTYRTHLGVMADAGSD